MASASRPPPRFPPWIVASSTADLPELRGPDAAEAGRLAQDSCPFVWKDAGLCQSTAGWDLKGLNQLLGGHLFNTNVSPRADRRFVYFSPSRLANNIYDPKAVQESFALMKLNEQMDLGEVRRRLALQAEDGFAVTLSFASGWGTSAAESPKNEAVFVLQVMLEGLSADEELKVTQLPKQLQPPSARMKDLPGEPLVIWHPGIAPLAKQLVGQAWQQLGHLARQGGWGPFQTAGLLISGRDTLTPLHYDRHHNVFFQVKGAKRFLLFGADQTPNLYGFPAMHAMDPLSRVDLEDSYSKEDVGGRWPRASQVRGVAVTLEAGDVLVMPQGVWHQVHSLDAENISVSFLFERSSTETALDSDGNPEVYPGQLSAARRAAALAEMAKTTEAFLAECVGPDSVASVLKAAHAACAAAIGGEAAESAPGKWSAAVDALRQFLSVRFVCDHSASGAEVDNVIAAKAAAAADQFVLDYFDPMRYDGLPLRRLPSKGKGKGKVKGKTKRKSAGTSSEKEEGAEPIESNEGDGASCEKDEGVT